MGKRKTKKPKKLSTWKDCSNKVDKEIKISDGLLMLYTQRDQKQHAEESTRPFITAIDKLEALLNQATQFETSKEMPDLKKPITDRIILLSTILTHIYEIKHGTQLEDPKFREEVATQLRYLGKLYEKIEYQTTDNKNHLLASLFKMNCILADNYYLFYRTAKNPKQYIKLAYTHLTAAQGMLDNHPHLSMDNTYTHLYQLVIMAYNEFFDEQPKDEVGTLVYQAQLSKISTEAQAKISQAYEIALKNNDLIGQFTVLYTGYMISVKETRQAAQTITSSNIEEIFSQVKVYGDRCVQMINIITSLPDVSVIINSPVFTNQCKMVIHDLLLNAQIHRQHCIGNMTNPSSLRTCLTLSETAKAWVTYAKSLAEKVNLMLYFSELEESHELDEIKNLANVVAKKFLDLSEKTMQIQYQKNQADQEKEKSFNNYVQSLESQSPTQRHPAPAASNLKSEADEKEDEKEIDDTDGDEDLFEYSPDENEKASGHFIQPTPSLNLESSRALLDNSRAQKDVLGQIDAYCGIGDCFRIKALKYTKLSTLDRFIENLEQAKNAYWDAVNTYTYAPFPIEENKRTWINRLLEDVYNKLEKARLKLAKIKGELDDSRIEAIARITPTLWFANKPEETISMTARQRRLAGDNLPLLIEMEQDIRLIQTQLNSGQRFAAATMPPPLQTHQPLPAITILPPPQQNFPPLATTAVSPPSLKRTPSSNYLFNKEKETQQHANKTILRRPQQNFPPLATTAVSSPSLKRTPSSNFLFNKEQQAQPTNKTASPLSAKNGRLG